VAAAAARVIAQAGLSATTLRSVAAEAGFTTGMVTHYFKDKRELLRFTLGASLDRRRLGAVPESDGDALARLRAKLEDELPVDDERLHHWLVTLAFSAEAGNDPEFAADQRVAYRWHRRSVVAMLEQARDDGSLAPGLDPTLEADRLIAVTNGVALQAIFDPGSWPAARQVDLVREAVASLRRWPSP
jgi:AcrR family transcriptional regulator